MPFTLTMPKLSPTMEEGSIAKWHKKVGDHVEAGDLLLEIATDKATIEHNALDEGWLRQILVEEGKEATVNQPIAIFTEEENESLEGYAADGGSSSKAPLQEKSSEKEQKLQDKDEDAPKEKELAKPSLPKEDKQESENVENDSARIIASPLAKRLAKDQSIDLAALKGSGPRGRIMKRDLEGAAKKQTDSQRSFLTSFSLESKKAFPVESEGAFEEITLTPIRKVIAQRLQEAKATIPHFYVQQTVDAENMVALREQLKNLGIAVTFNDIVMRAAALSLRENPVVNSGFDSKKNTLLRFKTVDISVAVSIEGGLITPIVRFADYKSIFEISEEVKTLSKRAKEGKLQPNEYQGGSFTVSNLGMYGVTDFQAIINPPQAAIVAVSGIADAAVVKNGAVTAGKQLNLTLSVDHRAIDGAAAAQFMKTLKLYLENPAVLLIA